MTTQYEQDLAAYRKAVADITQTKPKFSTLLREMLWCEEQAAKLPKKPEPEKVQQHAVYPYIGTSDRQRAYLVKHGIKHVRKDGEYR